MIIREIRSLPGELFKRSNIIRTQEELNRLGFFNPEALGVNPIPDPKTGNVDIEYVVEEKPADQQCQTKFPKAVNSLEFVIKIMFH